LGDFLAGGLLMLSIGLIFCRRQKITAHTANCALKSVQGLPSPYATVQSPASAVFAKIAILLKNE
jgi:hypothetical protein